MDVGIMAIKIYAPPIEVPLPVFDYCNFFTMQLTTKKWIKQLRAWVKTQHKGNLVGEVIHFPVNDGAAQYMVRSEKPLSLIHLPLGDAWKFPYVHLLNLSEVRKQVMRNK